MRTTYFTTQRISCVAQNGSRYLSVFNAPTLEAYAVTHLVGHFGPLTSPLPVSSINGSKVTVETDYELEDGEFGITVHYLGIRDYCLLFPTISDQSLLGRLGKFYEEMELSFEEGAWLSYMLMAGAVMEGLLHSKIGGSHTFEKLIDKAHSQSILTSQDKDLLHAVRKYRNLVHAGRHSEPYVNRQHAMDSRVLVDRLVRAA